MNPTLALIARRKSLRAFDEQPLTEEEKETILQAAFRAPTAGNMMLYSILEVEDQALKDRLAVICDHQPFIAKAPLVLIFLADCQRWHDYYSYCSVEQRCRELNRPYHPPHEGDLMLAVNDAVIAAQTAVIAAESIGMGSCYIGDILENCEELTQMFDLPPYVFPISMLCFGHPRPGYIHGEPTPRWYEAVCHHRNQYRRLDEDELAVMMQPLAEKNYPNGDYPLEAQNMGQVQYFRKTGSDFMIEMNRSVRKLLKNWG